MTIGYSAHYVYLGAHFTDDGKLSSVIKLHAADGIKHVNKFAIFVWKNPSMPFHLKKKVLNAALMSSILYGCETWLCKDIKAIKQLYITSIKTLLGVRKSTPNILCLLESGYPELEAIILKRRVLFITKFMKNMSGDEPLSAIYQLCRGHNTKGHRILCESQQYVGDPVANNIEQLKEKCRNQAATSSKFSTYMLINPSLHVHYAYSDNAVEYVPDYKRQSFSRLRLSAHRLRIETGRWSRTPREDRLCQCDLNEIQDERHVMFECPLSADIRIEYGIKNCDWEELFTFNVKSICEIAHKLLRKFD